MITDRVLTKQDKILINSFATHPLQSYEWGEFRKATGIIVVFKGIFDGDVCLGVFQMSIHKIPYTSYTIGYIPKGIVPSDEMLRAIVHTAKEYKCVFVQVEPNVRMNTVDNEKLLSQKLVHIRKSSHPLFTKYTLQLDLTKSEDELLRRMHPKTRYNIKVAQKHGVRIVEESSEEAFTVYWELTQETTSRQKFYAHTKKYHQTMWKILNSQNPGGLSAHLFLALYTPPQEKESIPLAAWILFTFHDTLYYPYGSSSSLYRNVMASNLMMWEAIRFGKKERLKVFDMWGSLGKDPDIHDPWYGFHRLKMGYAPEHIEFLGSYDIVINRNWYSVFILFNKIRWFFLRFHR